MLKMPISDNYPTLIAISGQLHQLMEARLNDWLCENALAALEVRFYESFGGIADQVNTGN